jgi:hypothetical protein
VPRQNKKPQGFISHSRDGESVGSSTGCLVDSLSVGEPTTGRGTFVAASTGGTAIGYRVAVGSSEEGSLVSLDDMVGASEVTLLSIVDELEGASEVQFPLTAAVGEELIE